VGSFPANEFGLHDLSGNVAEWCSSSWNKSSDERVLRGGSWNQSSLAALRLTTRQHALPVGPLPGAGFRVVLEAGPQR
jgi:formylglycine-generating enzyme required for sulfatase activity